MKWCWSLEDEDFIPPSSAATVDQLINNPPHTEDDVSKHSLSFGEHFSDQNVILPHKAIIDGDASFALNSVQSSILYIAIK